MSHSRIKLLDNRLANQIAAGEVVERPASVVKELLENSIDAGATKIEVDISRGGTRQIKITDDGYGICKDDLNLALCRHATSKISQTSDLAAINSLGFRGEALASISSVSRLTLTSRQSDSEFAWQAIAEGLDMQVTIQPASAQKGTRIEVNDLFFNTPARQKFLKAEKTEFAHIEAVFKSHALAHNGIAFLLKHNQKTLKRVPAINLNTDPKSRISSICGKPFADNAFAYSCQHESVLINGWLGKPTFHRSESDIQYVYINKRPVKDKTLSHAIRQAYNIYLPHGRSAAYVIYLTIDPRQIDVNVHPTKHEVRFSEQRLIHDLLAKSISDALAEQTEPSISNSCHSEFEATDVVESKNAGVFVAESSDQSKESRVLQSDYRRNVSEPKLKYSQDSLRAALQHQNSHLTQDTIAIENNNTVSYPIAEGYQIISALGSTFVVDESRYINNFLKTVEKNKIQLESKLLLFPAQVEINTDALEEYENLQSIKNLGFDFKSISDGKVSLTKIPQWLSDIVLTKIINLLERWSQCVPNSASNEATFESMSKSLLELDNIQRRNLLFHIISLELNRSEKSDQADKADKSCGIIELDQSAIVRLFAND